MLALFKVAPGIGNLELREVPRPRPEDGEVLIRVAVAGICGSDLHIFNWDTKVTMALPVIIGHEFSGTVEEVAGQAEGFKPGDRVTAEPTFRVCGRCLYCQDGSYNLCTERRVLGFAVDGAFAEHVRVPARRVHKLPSDIGFPAGALTEPLACCVHGLYELTGVMVGDLAVVLGPGTIGLLSAQLLKAAGARVVLIGTAADSGRLALAQRLGLKETINSGDRDPLERIKELSGGIGADIVVECSGAQSAANTGLELVRKRGKYAQLGLFGRPINFDLERVAYKEIRITGSFAQKRSAWKLALALMAEGSVQLEPLVSDTFPLRDWQQGFDKLNAKQGLKILLAP